MGSAAPHDEQWASLRFDSSSRSFPPESISSATRELAEATACVTD
jgi:hypothetical protein